ncbi:MAG TPA: hypothetical protein VM492_16605 [Sumerlaeia bacterium]|nr:hypothetical protein [Sumerlaeia bacterium]
MEADIDSSFVQVIIVIVITLAYGVWGAVRKIDRWIQTHRLPQSERGRVSAPVREVKASATSTRETMREAPRDLRTTLLEELEKAFRGVEEPVQEAAARPSPPRPAPTPPPLPEEAPPERAVRLDKGGKRLTSTGIEIQATASVRRSRLDHLAALRSPEDMKRAILLHEILSPPRAVRPFE